jgi:hypothetical protein
VTKFAYIKNTCSFAERRKKFKHMSNKDTQQSSLCNGLTKVQGSFCDTTQCNFVRQVKEAIVKLADARAITEYIACISILFSSH